MTYIHSRRHVLGLLGSMAASPLAYTANKTTQDMRRAVGSISIGDLHVPRIGFGAMNLTGPEVWGPPADMAAARALLRHVLDAGIQFIDTADAYGPGTNEELIAAALYPYRRQLLIATKGGIVRPAAPDWEADGLPDHLRDACHASLRRLRIERIDLYQLHSFDDKVPMEESLGALLDLQKAGKIRHIGISNVSVEELARAQKVVRVAAVQNRYNFADRRSEDVVKACEASGIAFIAHTPLAQSTRAPGAAARVAAMTQLARQRKLTLPQAAIAWLLSRASHILPIPGTSSRAHFDENMARLSDRLSRADMDAVDAE